MLYRMHDIAIVARKGIRRARFRHETGSTTVPLFHVITRDFGHVAAETWLYPLRELQLEANDQLEALHSAI